jgi:hypothetical protein
MDGPFSGQGALTENKKGQGRVFYCGWHPTQAQAEALLKDLAKAQGIEPLGKLPSGLFAYRRGPFTFLLNFTDEELEAEVAGQAVLTPQRGVRVLAA